MIQAITTAGAALSMFLLAVLAVKRPFRSVDAWLAVWFVAQGVFFGGVLLGLAAPPRVALVALLVGQIAMVVTGPAHYLYAASVLGARRQPRWPLAVTAAAGAVVFAIPVVVPIRVEAGALVADLHTPWLVLLPLTGFAVATLYPLGVLRLVRQRREQLKDQLSDISACDPRWLQVWAAAILTINVGLLVVAASTVVVSRPVTSQVVAILVMQVTHIAYVGQRGLTRPAVFFPATLPVERPRQRPQIDRLQAAKDWARMQALLAHERPHRLPHLTAAMLAERLGWAPERLTEALRHGGGVNFFDAINGARVQEVQQLARRPENAAISLLVLAHEAGFTSKSAFYDAFRRHAGCTPAAWRRRSASK